MDQTAIAMCKDNGLDLIVFSMNEKGNIKKAVLGEHVGTIVCKEENV
jgi:uridylate kinase